MNQGKTAKDLTKEDFLQAVAQAGGPKAIREAFQNKELSIKQLEKNCKPILEQYPRNWIAMGPEGMIANVPVPEGSTDEEEKQALDTLFRLIEDSGGKRACQVEYIHPKGTTFIL